jgi:hypothetical protein
VEKATKEVRDKKTKADDDVPGDVLKLVGEDYLRIMTKLINNIYMKLESGSRISLKLQWLPERRSQKLQNSASIAQSASSLISKDSSGDTTKRIARKIYVRGDDEFGFRRGKGTINASGNLRIISKQTFDTNEGVCAFFIDWQKALYSANVNKLMNILKETGIDWRERKLISKLYMDQSVQERLDQRESKSVKIEAGVRQGCCLSPILFNLYSEYLTKETVEGSGDFTIGKQVIHTLKYADYIALLAKEKNGARGHD